MELTGQEETDDLFFEQGHHSQELVKLVVSLDAPDAAALETPFNTVISILVKCMHMKSYMHAVLENDKCPEPFLKQS